MSNFWNAFSVYNKDKHSANSKIYGSNHMNLSTGTTTYLHSNEYREPTSKDVKDGNEMEKQRRMSESSLDSSKRRVSQSTIDDISKLSQGEFKEIYQSLRKGEPSNKVNF
ncbi:hypothetical protein Kpol_297p13 [Vanderwaltozyma polyspora DSM 70294]|uniref:Stationary phase protein 4 n=1 Tax=Vanderwaltozyma polyspora (strain ATCC 22028 / DSM 70294 / BCRC 21397 / CBS 2163 / NBRC 10782 / NRRL Y-8283 / UCD 57-17) TaxID=436907 RepID=SPG4_VANPO|nr:uncharacterized protein Kpol_297p13 [Vanderwaltozyma polyspora DSM 70294]A7TSL7.1 RecName: Full=Stationary phase protein 4 [Vanderwaltozyma polyspora DSM 70294]EDO14752.1 hypothetical protein Kpol_297p13 [Vanderwaltozyma polyspora DSM 70294]